MASDLSGARPRMRARRSQHRPVRPIRPARPARLRRWLAGLILAVTVAGLVVAGSRVAGFAHDVLNVGNPLGAVAKQVDAPAGSIPYKLQHGQRVNLLLAGYGGAENDAPYLTDSILVVSLDPATKRVMEVSVPRDLMVPIDAFAGQPPLNQKINAAYAIGMDDIDYPGKKPAYRSSRLAGGRLAEDTLTHVTGLQFDGFIGIDFKAFRDMVDALGGIDVTLDTPLDDCHYPSAGDGYVNGGVPVGLRCPSRSAGIHFPAGAQHVNGAQALELARSREASEPEQASDYGRARRQQMILGAIRKQAASAGGLTHAPQLMSALEKDYVSTLDLADLQSIYGFGSRLPESAIGHFGITEVDLVDRFFERKGSCGDFYADVLCPQDPSFQSMRAFFDQLFVDPKTLAERAPIEVVNGSATLEDLGQRVTNVLRPLGFQAADPLRHRTLETTTVYDFSGGRYPLSTQWMARYFGATVVTVTPSTPAPAGITPSSGIVVALGRDYARRWIGI